MSKDSLATKTRRRCENIFCRWWGIGGNNPNVASWMVLVGMEVWALRYFYLYFFGLLKLFFFQGAGFSSIGVEVFSLPQEGCKPKDWSFKIGWTVHAKKIDELYWKISNNFFLFQLFLISSLFCYIYIYYTYTTVHHKYPFLPYVCSIPKQLCRKRQRGMRLCRAGRRLARPARCVGSGLHLGGFTAGTGAPWKFNCLPLKIYRAPKGKGSSSKHQIFQGLC